MRRVLWDETERVSAWVGERVDAETFGPCVAIGVELDGNIIAGVVYNMHSPADIHMHVAVENGARLRRYELDIAFGYPFRQLKCKRITGLVRSDNLAAQRFDEHLGFVREGLKRRATSDGVDVIVYGMLREECRWLMDEEQKQ